MRDALIAIVGLGVLMFGARFLFSRVRPRPGPLHVASADGTFTLMQPRRNGILLGLVALAPAAVLGGLTFQAWRSGGMGFLVALVATLLALSVAMYLFASSSRSRLVVRDTGIERLGVFRRRLIAWASITRVAFNPAHHWFFITITDGSHLWVSADIAGAGDFAVLVLRRVRPAAIEADGPVAREVLEELAEAVRGQTPV